MKKSIFIFLLLTISLAETTFSQPTFEKIFRIDNQATEVCSVFPVADGYVLLSQHGKGIINLTKLDKDGEFEAGHDVFDSKSGYVMSASKTSAGEFLLTGVANEDDDSETGPQKGFFLKVSSNLDVNKAYNLVPFAGNGDCWASGAIETSDGSILLLAKSTVTSAGGIDNYFEVIKLNSSATQVIWQKAILAGTDNTVFDIAETSAGYEIYGAVKHKDTNWNLYLGTMSKDGTEMKRQLIVGGGDWDGAYDMQVDVKRKVYNHASGIVKMDENNLAIAAYTRSYGSNSANTGEKDGKSIMLLSYPVSGNSYNWTAILEGAKNEKLFGPFGTGNFISLANGDLLLSGYTNSTSSGSPYPGGFMYRFAAASDGTITPKWQHIFTPPNNLTPFALAENDDATLFLTGASGASAKEGVIIQTTADGLNPVGCISANEGKLNLQIFSPSVMSTTNAALFDGTLNLPYANALSNTTTITTVCSAQSGDVAIVPGIGMEPQSQTIASGQATTLTVLATGTPPIQYQWYQGESGDESTPVGTDSTTFSTPELTSTTKYWVKISNSSGEINSETAIITVEDLKWFQSDWGDYKQKPYQLLLTKGNTVLVLTQDVVTQFGTNDWPCSSPPGKLYAVNPETGAVLWSIDLGHSAAPAISGDGYIYTNIENRFYQVNPANGQMSLVYTADRNITSSPALSKDGMAYFGAGQKVLAINLNTKTLEWEEPTDKFVIQHPSIGTDGTVYLVPWRMSSKMYAFWPHKTFDNNELKWVCNIPGFFSTAPSIGLDGMVYAGAYSKLYAINPVLGTIKWEFTTPIAPAGYPTIQNITSEPVIGNNGTIYFSALTMGDAGGALFAIHPDGYPKWFFSSGIALFTSPVLADDETIYYPAEKLHVLDMYGKEIWSKDGAGSMSPVLSPDGNTYFGSWEHNGISAISGNHGGIATAHWPAFAHDFQRTAQHDDSFAGIPPIITKQPENLLIKSGQTATFSVSVSGDPVITYQWYEGVAGDKSKPVGADSVYTTPPLTKMTNFWIEVENEFGKDISTTVMASTGNKGEVKWFYNTNPTFSYQEDGEITGGVALADDGTLYFGVADARLFAMNPDGTVKWITAVQAHKDKYRLTNAIYGSTPTVGNDGTIYIGTLGYYNEGSSRNFGFLWAINPDGSEKWRYETGDFKAGEGSVAPWVRGNTAIGYDGTIYVVSEDGVLHALNPDGSLKWKFKADEYTGWLRGLNGSPAVIGHNGTIYYAAEGEFELYDVSTREARLFALNPDGSCKWDFVLLEDRVFFSEYAPAIGPDGKIFIDNGDGYVAKLYAINSDGTEAWQFHAGSNVASSVVIDADSTIYVGGSVYVNSHQITLYALNPDGTEKWRFPKEGDKTKFGFAFADPVIGADGNIYIGNPTDGNIYALRPDGTELWSNPPNVGGIGYAQLVIAPDGTLFAGTGSGSESNNIGFMFAVNTSAFGVANTSWPMAGHDPRRTSRTSGSPQCEAPLITLQPKDTTIFSGEAVKLTLNATGTELNYQWYEGADRSKPMGTGTSFVTPDLDETTSYWVEVSNTCGSVNSRTATVSVTAPQLRVDYATLANILVNNEPIESFNSEVYEYFVVLPAGTVEVPDISAFSSVIGAEVEITKASSLPGNTLVDVISPDGVTKQTYIIHFTLATGIFNPDKNDELKIYPNPVSEKLTVALPETTGFYNLKIVNSTSKIILLKESFSDNEIDVSGLSTGVYFLSLQNMNETFIVRFIKK